MHTVTTKEIMPRVTLTCVKTEKFKTGCLSVSLLTGLSNDTASKSALLPRVLRRGTESLPDMASLAAALDDMYGARIEPLVRKKGETQCVGFYADFVDDAYVPEGAGLLRKSAALLGEMLLSPAMPGGLLNADYVEGERRNLIDEIRAGINDKRGYAIDRLIEEMCTDEAFGVNRLGSEETAARITPEALTEYYRELLESSEIHAFYCGTAESGEAEDALRAALNALPRGNAAGRPATEVRIAPQTDTPRRFTEALDVGQGKLTIGFRIGETMTHPSYPALMVFNAIYGGAVTSKLFMNVREKLSLCYYASSLTEKHKGVMLVSSGVEFARFDEALREIYAQLDAIRNGDVSDFELQSAKSAVTTAIKSSQDRPMGLEDMYLDRLIAAVSYDPMELCGGVEAVTLDDVTKIANGIRADAEYFLTGLGGDGDGV